MFSAYFLPHSRPLRMGFLFSAPHLCQSLARPRFMPFLFLNTGLFAV